MTLSGREVYTVVASAFQVGLALLLLAGRERGRLRGALVVILAANAWETINITLARWGAVPPSMEWLSGDLLDPIIVITVAFVLSQIPSPLGGPRGARVAFAVWTAMVIAWTIYVPLARTSPDATRLVEIGKYPAQTIPFLTAAYLLTAHVVPRWRALPCGPLRGQVLLLASALGIGLAATGLVQLLGVGSPGGDPPREVVLSTLTAFVAAAIAQLVWGTKARDGLLFAGILASGFVFSASDVLLGNSMNEFSAQAIRPALVAFAILRYDLVDAPFAMRGIVAPATAIAFALTLFFGLNAMATGQFDALDPTVSAASLALMALALVAARRPLSKLLRTTGGERGADVRIDRYRIALEAEGPPFRSSAVLELRQRLRITDEEHETLVAILRSHLVVPTRAVRGLAAGEVVAGRYHVVRELGRGGQGRALLAQDAAGASVVLKEVARPWEEGAAERREALVREADAGARVDSPRVARVLGLFEDAGVSYLAREFVPGRSLDAVLREEGPLSPERARSIMGDVLKGLAAIHDAGLLHLDLKPSNVILDPAGRAVLIDLGTARRDAAPAGATLTQGAVAGGTLGWMPPEQAAGARVGRAADIYGAGALLAYFLTGRAPTPGSVPAAEGELGARVRRACAVDPSERYSSAEEMHADLHKREGAGV